MARDLTGQPFGRLTAKRRLTAFPPRYTSYWECECDCGSGVVVKATLANLTSGNTQSCGCLKKEVATETILAAASKFHAERTRQVAALGLNPPDELTGERALELYKQHASINVINNLYYPMQRRHGHVHGLLQQMPGYHDLAQDRLYYNRTYDLGEMSSRRAEKHEYNGMHRTLPQWAKQKGVVKETLYLWLKKGYSLTDFMQHDFSDKPVGQSFNKGKPKGCDARGGRTQ